MWCIMWYVDNTFPSGCRRGFLLEICGKEETVENLGFIPWFTSSVSCTDSSSERLKLRDMETAALQVHSPYHRDKWRSPKTHPIRSTIPWGRKPPKRIPPYNQGQGAKPQNPPNQEHHPMGAQAPQVHPTYHRGQGAKPPKKRVEGAQHPPNIPPPHRGGGRGWGQLQEHYPQKKNLKNIPPKNFFSQIFFSKTP